MKPFKYIAVSLLGTVLVSLGACKGFLEESILDKTQLSNFLKTDPEAVSFLYGGLYAMRNVCFGQNYLSVYELPNDQTHFATGSDQSRRNMSRMEYDPNTSFVENVWGALYKTIGQMNILIDNLENESGPLSGSEYKQRLNAQARFLRAYCYFDAVRLWGEVPITRAYYDDTGDIKPARSPIEDVYALIIADLKYGIDNGHLRDFSISSAGAKIMPDAVKFKYPDDEDKDATNYYLPFSKGAAQLLLAKVYLTRNAAGDYALAEGLVDGMIANSGPGKLYDLLPKYGDLFQADTKTVPNRYREVLFELEASADGGNNQVHRQIGINKNTGIKAINTGKKDADGKDIPISPAYLYNTIDTKNTSGYGYYRPTEYFVGQFDGMKDERYFWLFQIVRETDGPHYFKGRDHTASHNDNGYCNAVLLRFADAYLIKAEIRARANDGTGVKTAMDPILTRAGLDAYDPTGKTQEEMIDDVLMERNKEFALEAGNRLFDMRRTGFEAEMTKYQKWYKDNVTETTHTGPKDLAGTTQVKTLLLMNPLAKGNPVNITQMIDVIDNNGVITWKPTTRQDQFVGGDYFEYPVPFSVNNPSGDKKYNPKCDWHPIPTRELMQNGNLNPNLHVPNWN